MLRSSSGRLRNPEVLERESLRRDVQRRRGERRGHDALRERVGLHTCNLNMHCVKGLSVRVSYVRSKHRHRGTNRTPRPFCLGMPVSDTGCPSHFVFLAHLAVYSTSCPSSPPGINSDAYVGEWRRGQREGKGVLSLANGDRFVSKKRGRDFRYYIVLRATTVARKDG